MSLKISFLATPAKTKKKKKKQKNSERERELVERELVERELGAVVESREMVGVIILIIFEADRNEEQEAGVCGSHRYCNEVCLEGTSGREREKRRQRHAEGANQLVCTERRTFRVVTSSRRERERERDGIETRRGGE